MKVMMAVVLLVACSIVNNVLHACWLPPPDVVWGKSDNGQFEFKRENKTGRITVYKAGERENALWEVVVPEFSSIFSRVVLADSGELVLHIRSNHQVWKLTDTAIHVLKKDGFFSQLAASEFIDKLRTPSGPRRSIDPNSMWMNRFVDLTEESFRIINANGEKREVRLTDIKSSSPQQEAGGYRR